MTETELYDKMVGFYAPLNLVDRFNAKCKERSINKSEWFRAQMEAFVGE